MMSRHCLALVLMVLTACQDWIAPVESGLDDCTSQGGCEVDEFCAEGLCFPLRCVVNGILEPGEACDDGNTSDLDTCSNRCTLARCGDGLVRQDKNPGVSGYEACDDGNENNSDACSNDCRLPSCGDGFLAQGQGEACDDGNLENADACLNDCSLARCGDGILRGGLAVGDVGFEACDDGNDSDGDACTTDCRLARCGDGILREDQPEGTSDFEACDDGNEEEGDACTHDCRAAACGDGVLRNDLESGEPGYEACDDGNDEDLDDCTTSCERPRCGDGLLNGRPGAEETCDDGNQDNSDACLDDCSPARCGDGFRRGDLDMDHPDHEVCDDGNADDTDVCLSSCELNRCGDGHVFAGNEACDDGNDEQSDGCLNDCSVARCGDGLVHEGEEACDDGNDSDADACLSNCVLARCGDGIVRQDLMRMADVGFENCEPELDNDGEHCGWDCRRRRQPRRVVVGDDGRCVLHEDRVWCSGQAGNARGRFEPGPLTLTPAGLEGLVLTNTKHGYFCVIWDRQNASCQPVLYANEVTGISAPEPLVDINYGARSSSRCTLSIYGRVRCWRPENPVPRQIEGLENIIAISTHEEDGLAVDDDGVAFAWRGMGQAQAIPNLPPLKDVTVQLYHPTRAGLTRDGRVIDLANGQVLRGLPEATTELVTNGGASRCALLSTGAVYCRGSNSQGQVGNGTYVDQRSFVHVVGLEQVETIAGGSGGFCALTDRQELWCWGRLRYPANGEIVPPAHCSNQQWGGSYETWYCNRPTRITGHPLP